MEIVASEILETKMHKRCKTCHRELRQYSGLPYILDKPQLVAVCRENGCMKDGQIIPSRECCVRTIMSSPAVHK